MEWAMRSARSGSVAAIAVATPRRMHGSVLGGRGSGPCPLRARRESKERYLTGTDGQPRMLPYLRSAGQRGMTIRFPS